MLVPKLRFKEFKEEWKKISLINIFTIYNTNSLSRADLSDEGLIKNIHYGDIHQKFNNILDVNKEKLPYIKSEINIRNGENYCQDGDLIFADASEDYEGIGKAIEVINVGNNKIASGLHTILARDTKKVMSLGFKGYLFNTSLIHNQIRVLANGFKVYGISKNNIYDLDVRIPTKMEQEKITKFLILLDKKIELQQRKIEALKIYKKGLMAYLFNNSSNKYIIFLKNICTIRKGQQLNKENMSLFGNYYVLNGGSELSGYTNNFNVQENTISISEGGNSCGFVNFNIEKFWAGGHCYILDNISQNINIYYLFHLLKYNQEKIMNLRVGSGLPNI